MSETEYRVRVEIDVEAADAVNAAKIAFKMLRAPDCTPWVCEVFPDLDTSRAPVPVDLDRQLDPNRSVLPVDESMPVPSNRERCHASVPS